MSTPTELVALLMKREIPLVRNFTEHLLAYAIGRRAEYFDGPGVRAIARAAEADDYRMSSFILGVVNSDPFRLARPTSAADEHEPTETGTRSGDGS